MSRKAVVATVVAATVAWSISLSAFLAPLTAKAAVSSGMLVKASMPAVYYVGQDGKRYVFPNEKTYKTWYADFSTVVVITDAELASLPIGGNVTYRPGVKLVKIQTDPKVYAVAKNGTLRWVTSEALAVSFYGADWNTADTHDVPDAFFTNYTVGADINSTADYNPAAETAAATSINADKNLGTGAVTGAVTVSNPGQPAGGTLPRGAVGVQFVRFNVRNNSSAAATVGTVTVHRTGPGATTDFSNVYVYNGSERVTTGRTLNSSTNAATFSGLNLSIAPGVTANLWIAADMSATAGIGNVNSLEVTDVMVGGASALGTPVAGPSFTMASATVGTTTIDDSGTLSSVKAGGPQQKVAEFTITAPSTEDAELRSLALFYAGTANRSDVTNLTLKQAGLTLATTSSITSKDLAVFSLSSPMFLEKGAVRTFQVYADIGATARAAETVGFYVDQATDVVVVGRTYGFGTQVTNNWTAIQSATVEAGRLTTTFNGPAAHDIAQNGKDQELFNFTMAAQANLEIRQTDFVVTAGAAADCNAIDDFKVIDVATGAIIAGPVDLSNGADNDATCESAAANSSDAVELTETWNINAGQSRTFKVTADIATAFTANNTLQVTLGDGADLFDANKVRNLDNSTYLASTDFVPSSPINGNTNTIKTTSLTTAGASTPVAQSYIQGTQGAELAGITLKAGDAGAVKVNTVKFTGFVDNDGDGATSAGQQGCDTGCVNSVAELVPTLKLWNGTTQLGDTETPTTSTAAGNGGVVTFDNLNLTIPAGTTVTLKLAGDLAGGQSNLSDDVYFSIAAVADVTATDVDGATITPSGTPTGPQMTIASAGTVSVASAPDDVESEAANIIGGASNVVLGKFRFTAQNEELKLTKQRIRLTTAANDEGITSISLYDGNTLVGGPVGVDTSGNADFTNVNFVIPKDSSRTLTVKANLNTVGTGGAATGLDVSITLEVDDSFEVRGTGAGSNTQITDGGTDVAGRQKVLRKTKPTVALVALPSTTFTAGDITVMRFTVSADAAGDVSMKKVTAQISVAATGTMTLAPQNAATSSIRRVGDGSNLAGTSVVTDTLNTSSACTAADLTCYFQGSFEAEEVIAAGTSRTYDIIINNATTAPAAGNSISVKLLGDSVLATGAAVIDAASTAPFWGTGTIAGSNWVGYNFLWSDYSAVPHNACTDTNDSACEEGDANVAGTSSSSDWTNGLYVKVLPTDQQTLTKS